jgi:hypothetical protein
MDSDILQRRPLKYREPISLRLYRIRVAGPLKLRFNFFMCRIRNCMGNGRTIDRILFREEITNPSETAGIVNSDTRFELRGDILHIAVKIDGAAAVVVSASAALAGRIERSKDDVEGESR